MTATAQASEYLRFACNDFPPHKIANPEDPALPGFDVEILTHAFAESNRQVQTPYYPWNRALHLAENGTVAGLCSCSYRPEREDFLLFSEEMGTVSSGIFRTETAAPVYKLGDLKGRAVGVVSGYSLEMALIDAGAKPVVAQDDEAAARMLAANRFDYLYGFKAATEFHLRNVRSRSRVHYQEITRTPYFLCVSKKHRNAKRLLEDFNQGLQTIRDNGTLQTIMDKYR